MPEDDTETYEAALNAVDPDRLLPGEEPNSVHRDDAEHWIEVYRELLAYKERMLQVSDEMLRRMPERPARREVAETDLDLLRSERDRFVRRLRFWSQRLTQLDTTT